MRMLIISRDEAGATSLVDGFRLHGFTVDHALESQQGSFWARTTDYDLVLIDDEPDTGAGLICQRIRALGKTMPIIIVSDHPNSETKVSFLNAGADDCVSKDCSVLELTTRARTIMRRGPNLKDEVLRLDDLRLNIAKYQVTRGKTNIVLTRKEFGILEYLLRNKGRVIPRTALVEHVWDVHADLFSNTLETHIVNLRKKIEHPNRPKLIHTISGRGYKIAVNP